MIYGYGARRSCDPGRAAVEQELGLAIVAGDDSYLPLLLRRRGRHPCVRPLDHHNCECSTVKNLFVGAFHLSLFEDFVRRFLPEL